ncbi:grasp-with-spasm system SPASM domain peptide maturase [Corallococcus sp. AB050B]|nr:grasp-with-spasm system SPASM domain peptide maturase [Corallococcus sp. AB050B]
MTGTTGAAPPAFRLFPSCRLVEGTAYCAVYDLERRRLFRFHRSYLALFQQAASPEGLDVAELEGLEGAARQRAREAVAFLREHELGHDLDEFSARHIAPLADVWDAPEPITNAIIDVDGTEHDWDALSSGLRALQCRALQIRSYGGVLDPTAIERALAVFATSTLQQVEILARWSPAFEALDWPALFLRHRLLVGVELHGAPRDEQFDAGSAAAFTRRPVRLRTASVDGPQACGRIVAGALSTPSVALFSELRRHNGCLNRKLSIRADGEICNCPSMRAGYGRDLGRLREIAESPAFRGVWDLKKDDLKVCRGCEFRYVCTDCRAYLESDRSTAKPARCGYDPATGRWADGTAAAQKAPDCLG